MKGLAILFAVLLSAQVNAAAEQGKSMPPDTMMGFLNHEQMTKMHDHVEEMQAAIQALKKEKDPAKRKELMQKHMDNMNDSMKMLGGAMMGTTGNSRISSMSMDERMNMMQGQLGMMQMMMEQMMEHYSQDSENHK